MGSVFAKRFNPSIRDLLKKPVFEKGDGNWIDVLPTITKQYNNRVRSSTKLKLIQDSLKKLEGVVFNNFLDKLRRVIPNFQINDLVRTGEIKKTFSKGNTTNWSFKLYKFTEIFNNTIPSYHIDNIPERYNEALLKKTELPLKEKKLKEKSKHHLSQIKLSLTVAAYRT